MRWITLSLILAGCAAKVTPTQSDQLSPGGPTAQSTAPPAPPTVPMTPEQKEQAAMFDRFIAKKNKKGEKKALEEACTKDPKSNPFCYFVSNYDALEAKLHQKSPRPKGTPRVAPKFSGKQITNWDKLRADSLGHLIKAFARVGSTKLRYAKAIALNETQCPNNAALAIAATSEDYLPDRGADFGEIAQLYEKGGECLTNPDDRENMLTRAGLFYYLKKDAAHATAVWQRSAAIDAAKSPRPFFWLYRMAAESGDRSAAQAALKALKEKFPFAFHTVMGRLRDNQEPDDILGASASTSLKKSDKVASANAMVSAAEMLITAGFPKSASKVLDWTIQEAVPAEPEFRLYLAELKAANQETHHSIFLLSKILIDNPGLVTRPTLQLYFPKVFLPLFEKHAQELDPFLLLAVARQESAFDTRAYSPAKAKGLLQVVAKRFRKQNGKDLFDPELNIKTGSRMFSQILAMSDGKIHVALSGYNAGPRRALNWVKRYTTVDPILFIDLIPFKETRAYVALILRNYYWYRRLHSPGENRLPWVAKNDAEGTLWLGPPSQVSKLP